MPSGASVQFSSGLWHFDGCDKIEKGQRACDRFQTLSGGPCDGSMGGGGDKGQGQRRQEVRGGPSSLIREEREIGGDVTIKEKQGQFRF